MLRLLFPFICVIFTACMPNTITGNFQNSATTLSGKVAGDITASGILEIETSTGLLCQGPFNYAAYHKGLGRFTCSDGSTGPFEFDAISNHWIGHGQLGNQTFSFRINY